MERALSDTGYYLLLHGELEMLGRVGVVGEHNGYAYLPDPVTHRRTLELDGPGRTLLIHDGITANGKHEVEVCFHFAEHCTVAEAGANRYLIDVGPGTIEVELDSRLEVESFHGSDKRICEWVSRGYHQKPPSTMLIGRRVREGNLSLICTFGIGGPAAGR